MIKSDRTVPSSIRERIRYEEETGKLFWVNGPMKGRECGWVDQYGYRLTRFEGQLLRNHHIVWYLHYGEWPKTEIDHKDNDPSNNRIDNLREANRHQQGANQKIQRRREGMYKGVYVCGNKWTSKIKVKGKSKHLGMFGCEEDAARAYNEAAIEYFGEFANLNDV